MAPFTGNMFWIGWQSVNWDTGKQFLISKRNCDEAFKVFLSHDVRFEGHQFGVFLHYVGTLFLPVCGFEVPLHHHCVRYTVKSDDCTRKFTQSEYGCMESAKIAALKFDEKIKRAVARFSSLKRSPKDSWMLKDMPRNLECHILFLRL